MEDNQLKEIRQFLQSKRLPIDVLMEVEDHFVMQILELEKSGIGFAEAFSRVQTNWISDLKMTYDVSYSLDDIAVITKNIIKQNRNTILKKAIVSSVVILIVLIFSRHFTTEKQFSWLLTTVVSACILFPACRFLVNYKIFKLPGKYPDFMLSIYQHNNAISLTGFAIYFSWFSHFEELSNRVYALFSNEQIGFQFYSVFYIFLLLFGNLYCLFNQNQYLKSIHGIKNYLEKTQLS